MNDSMKKIIHIAIDGPAGAGKSTIAKKIADKLNILYLDTGAMYRAFTYYALQNNIDSSDKESLIRLLDSFFIEFDEGSIFLNREDITDKIRTSEIDKAVSFYASKPFIRNRMVLMQREIAADRSVVMEGRDIGSVVLKDTPYKFYLNASIDVRAQRRYAQIHSDKSTKTVDDIKNEIIMRDELDTKREADPLVITNDSIVIDTSHMTLDEVTNEIIQRINFGDRDEL